MRAACSQQNGGVSRHDGTWELWSQVRSEEEVIHLGQRGDKTSGPWSLSNSWDSAEGVTLQIPLESIQYFF